MWVGKKLYCWKCKLMLEVHTGTATPGSHTALKDLNKSRLSQQEEKNHQTSWLLGIELRTFGRAGNALNL